VEDRDREISIDKFSSASFHVVDYDDDDGGSNDGDGDGDDGGDDAGMDIVPRK